MAKKAVKQAAGRKAARSTVGRKRPGQSKHPAHQLLHADDLQHRLSTLLHTMRCIAQHEDELCTLLNGLRPTGRLKPALLRELRTVLRELPAEEYIHDVYAVQEAVTGS